MNDQMVFNISIDDVKNIYEADKKEIKDVSQNCLLCNTCKSCQAGKC